MHEAIAGVSHRNHLRFNGARARGGNRAVLDFIKGIWHPADFVIRADGCASAEPEGARTSFVTVSLGINLQWPESTQTSKGRAKRSFVDSFRRQLEIRVRRVPPARLNPPNFLNVLSVTP